MTQTKTSTTSYTGLWLLCGSLVFVVILVSLAMPIARLTEDEYQSAVLLALAAYSPLLLITRRVWFRVVVGILLAVWAYYLLGALFWGGPSLLYLLVPIPLAICWFVPPAPADRRTFTTMAVTAVVCALIYASTMLAVSANDGGVLYLCSEVPVDASMLDEVHVADPRGGYRLPDGVTTLRAVPGGYAFHFAPFTQDERQSLSERALDTDWVTTVQFEQPCQA